MKKQLKSSLLLSAALLSPLSARAAVQTVTVPGTSVNYTFAATADASGNLYNIGALCGNSSSAALGALCQFQVEVNSSGQLLVLAGIASGGVVAGALADGAVTTLGTEADTAWTSGSGTEIAILKAIANAETSATRSVNLTQVNGSTYSATNPGFNEISDGTNTASVKAASTSASSTDKSVVVQINPQQSPPVKLTDGTNTAAVKAASTAAAASDPAVVVAISPNNTVPVADKSFSTNAAVNTIQADASAPINVSSTTAVQLVASGAVSGIWVTSWHVTAGGSGNFTLEYGTQTTNPCDTGTVALTGPEPLIAQSQTGEAPGKVIYHVPSGNQLCALVSTTAQMSGSISYTKW
jgi:hypothetical protein